LRRRSTTHLISAQIVAVGVALTLIAGCSSSGQEAAAPATLVPTIETGTTSTAPRVPDATAPSSVPPSIAAPVTDAPSTEPPAAPTTTADVPVATPVATPCPATAQAGFACFTVAVPTDPAAPAGATIDLAVTVRRIDPSTWTSPVLSENDIAPAYPWEATPQEPFVGHDVIWIDQRGAGRSDGAVDCPGLSKFGAELNSFRLTADAAAEVRSCIQVLSTGEAPVESIFDHDVTAADVVAVRRALGITHWSVYASGGAADILLRLVRVDADAITSITTRNPEVVGTGAGPNTLAEAFDRFADGCAAAPTCAALGDLRQSATAALTRLQTPVTTSVTATGTGVPIVLDDVNIQAGIRTAMQDPSLASVLPGLIVGLVTGTSDDTIARYFDTYDPETNPIGLASRCQLVDYAFPGIEQTSADSAGPFAGFSLQEMCDQIGPVPQFTTAPDVRSDIPVFVILPAYAAGSSRDNAEQIFSGFPNTTIVGVPGISNPYEQLHDCFQSTTDAFFTAPTTPIDTSCLTDSSVTPFT